LQIIKKLSYYHREDVYMCINIHPLRSLHSLTQIRTMKTIIVKWVGEKNIWK